MTEIPVIDINKAKAQAWQMGAAEFHDVDIGIDEFDLSPFYDTARWANIVLPKLRAQAGYEDGGHGTYQGDREVVVVEEPGDQPATGERVASSDVLAELTDAFSQGAYDAVDGE